VAASAETGLGNLEELAITTERMATLLVAITPEYFLFASLAPGALMGRARFALRLAGLSLRREGYNVFALGPDGALVAMCVPVTGGLRPSRVFVQAAGIPRNPGRMG